MPLNKVPLPFFLKDGFGIGNQTKHPVHSMFLVVVTSNDGIMLLFTTYWPLTDRVSGFQKQDAAVS